MRKGHNTVPETHDIDSDGKELLRIINKIQAIQIGQRIALQKDEVIVNRTHLKFAVVLVLMLVALLVSAQSIAQGKISAVKGVVQLVRGQSAPVQLRKHDPIQADDEIFSDSKSSATLRMTDGSSIRIYPNSRVVLRRESGRWKEFLSVLLGNVRVQIEKLSGGPNPKTVTTPTAIIAVRGTVFAVTVDQAKGTEVGVERGLVSVANQAYPEDEVLVRPGESVWARAGQRLGQPQLRQKSMTGINMNGWRGGSANDASGASMRSRGFGGSNASGRSSGSGRHR